MVPGAVYLVRHGESADNVEGPPAAVLPDHRVPLTERGQVQAEAAGAWLAARCQPPVWVWSSTHLRAQQTLAALGRGGLRADVVRHTPLLREQEWSGSLDTPESDLQRASLQDVVGRFHLRLPGGESRADVFLRVTVWMDELWRAFRDEERRIGSVVVVTHGVALLMIRGRWLHWDVARLESAPRPHNGGIHVLRHTPGAAPRWRDCGEVFVPEG